MKRHYKIIIDARYMNSFPNGLAMFTNELTLPFINSLKSKGVRPDLIGVLVERSVGSGNLEKQKFIADLVAAGISIIRAPVSLSILGVVWDNLFIVKNKIDVWVNYHYHIPILPRSKFYVIVHDLMPVAINNYILGRGSFIKRNIFKFFILRAIIWGDVFVFVPSKFTLDEIKRYFAMIPRSWGLLEPGIPNSIVGDFHRWSPDREKIVISFIGERRPHKNVDRLISIVQVINKVVHCELLIAGKNRDYGFTLKTLLSDKIRYLGEVDDLKKCEIMLQSSYVALISTYEGYGIPVSEANALGVPVIVHKISVMAERCSYEDCLINLEDSDTIIARNIIEHWKMGQEKKWRKSIKLRTWETVANEFIKTLDHNGYNNNNCL
jgi:glycosyltransferase involved in cell wall biosynthesis